MIAGNRWAAQDLPTSGTAIFLLVDAVLVVSCSLKIMQGGWFPLVMGAAIFAVMATWKRGRELLIEHIRRDDPELLTSQAQAITPLPHVVGLMFLGFPLHPPGKPSSERADHLKGVHVPMLFLQGTRDKLAECARMSQVVSDLGAGSVMSTVQDADHGFDVLVRSGRTHDDVLAELLDGMANWMNGVLKLRS